MGDVTKTREQEVGEVIDKAAAKGKTIVVYVSVGMSGPLELSKLMVAIGELYRSHASKPPVLKFTIEVVEERVDV